MFSDRLKAAWDSRDPKVLAALAAPDAVRTNFLVEEQRIEGRDALLAFVVEVLDAYPDCTVEIRRETGSGSHVVVEWIFRGTQVKDFGTIPGRGQAVVLSGISVFEMDGDLIRDEHTYWDNATLLAAAGLLG